MIDSVLNVLGRAINSRPFEDYYAALLVRDPDTAPTAKEARQDYMSSIQARATLYALLG